MKEKWTGYTLKLEYEERLNFTKAELLKDFSDAYVKMSEMSVELENGEKSQVSTRIYFFSSLSPDTP